MIQLIEYALNGALLGLLYALIAMGFVVIYRASKVFNFAQGELVVVGAFLVWFFTLDLGLPLYVGLALALAGAAIFGLVIEPLLFRRLVGQSTFAMVMVTIGLLILLRGLVLVIFGPSVRPFPALISTSPVNIGDITLNRGLLFGGIFTIVLAIGVSLYFSRTRPGLRMTVVAEDHQIAQSMGISVRRSIAYAWAMGMVLSTLAAVFYLNGKSVTFLVSEIGFAALPVALLAGLESVGGLIPAGIIVGVAQGLAAGYIDPLIGGSFSAVFPYLVMVTILFLRPSGLFGWRIVERV
ncbi:branched-chain amino acid ABC transporter permease [Blastococcus mobilis]|uniref:Amino acid/amide ABC transporter membrane protein 1, HAAT family n=1 Tax=Blastococcus mobilis TaxID=1938746 RepID=A0A238X4M6_9ACTN|nr:branched-chain amino acid ABC transporter permease [Blastococcus mobilis]SNR53518.1 amino acid/amide ABC transporter membrane protein 1, HAAT family [Blastococcus mobilis]